MDWITGIQNAIDYIENHLTEVIDYNIVAEQSFSSTYHFQRLFSILCGVAVGEYIRNRRLSLAGSKLATTDIKVFHGVTPSSVRMNGRKLKSISRLILKISLESGKLMNYRIEEKPERILTGYKKHFTGAPYGKEREQQEE